MKLKVIARIAKGNICKECKKPGKLNDKKLCDKCCKGKDCK